MKIQNGTAGILGFVTFDIFKADWSFISKIWTGLEVIIVGPNNDST